MAKCTKCNRQIADDMRVCDVCGALICADCSKTNNNLCPNCFCDIKYLC